MKSENLNRTTKLELDEARAQTVDEAHQIVSQYVLQIEVGDGIYESKTRQAMLLTAINASSRAFIGGVKVRFCDDVKMDVHWSKGKRLSESIVEFGGETVGAFSGDYPTLVIGRTSSNPKGSIVLYLTWEGWSGGVVQDLSGRLPESIEFPLTGVLAAAIGVSETFQHVRGYVVAGRRCVGLSLWKPLCDWRSSNSFGDKCHYLPNKLWLIGLGHLGQAYAWALGLLPYPDPVVVDLILQDYDSIIEANTSTGMLTDATLVGRKKTRVLANRLEEIGFATTITERPFGFETKRYPNEPMVALVGVDDTEPRRLLESAGFELVIDAGLGGNPQNYLDILIHTFPSSLKATMAWPDESSTQDVTHYNQPAYQAYKQLLKSTSGASDGEAECGVIEIAGQSVGAAFVGCVAATLVIAEVLRQLSDGPRFELISYSLRSPHRPQIVANKTEKRQYNPGFVQAVI